VHATALGGFDRGPRPPSGAAGDCPRDLGLDGCNGSRRPFGTLVGNQLGWRATFVMVAGLGAVALLACCSDCPAACRAPPRRSASESPSPGAAPCCMYLRSPFSGGWRFHRLTYLSVPLQALGSVRRDQHGIVDLRLGRGDRQPCSAARSPIASPDSDRDLGLVGMVLARRCSRGVEIRTTGPGTADRARLIFCWVSRDWAFYTAQVASIVRIEPVVATIALSLNASAMYLGFAIGGITGAVVLSSWPTDLGWQAASASP